MVARRWCSMEARLGAVGCIAGVGFADVELAGYGAVG